MTVNSLYISLLYKKTSTWGLRSQKIMHAATIYINIQLG